MKNTTQQAKDTAHDLKNTLKDAAHDAKNDARDAARDAKRGRAARK